MRGSVLKIDYLAYLAMGQALGQASSMPFYFEIFTEFFKRIEGFKKNRNNGSFVQCLTH